MTDAAQTAPLLDSPAIASNQAATAEVAPVTYATVVPQHQMQYIPAPVGSYRHHQQHDVAMAYQPLHGLTTAQSMVAYAAEDMMQPQLVQPDVAPQISASPAEASNEMAAVSLEAPAKEKAPAKKKTKSKRGCC